jgi:hypothetical protein
VLLTERLELITAITFLISKYISLDIIYCPVLYLKHYVSETGFYLRLQVELIQIGPTERATLSPETKLSRIYLKTETESSLRNAVFWIKDRTMNNVQNCDSYITIKVKLSP